MPFSGNIWALCVIGASLVTALWAGPPTNETNDETSETDSGNTSDKTAKVSTSTEIDTSLYVRSDTDHTTVVSPRIRFHQGFQHHGGETGLNLG